jgi:uncharacterized protein DUF2188
MSPRVVEATERLGRWLGSSTSSNKTTAGGHVATAGTNDTHARLENAIAHATELATAHRPAEIYLHRLDGTVESVGLT